jgi:hypothetical protein
MIKVAILVALLANTTLAGTLHGDKATVLTQALRYAGIKPTVTHGTRTFRVATIDCVRMLENDTTLADHQCTVDKAAIKDAAAYLLYEAMEAGAFTQTPDTATHIKMATANLACSVDTSKQVQCTWDGAGGEPPPDVIAPKKTKVKDIVQPVKIEKQPKQ